VRHAVRGNCGLMVILKFKLQNLQISQPKAGGMNCKEKNQ